MRLVLTLSLWCEHIFKLCVSCVSLFLNGECLNNITNDFFLKEASFNNSARL